MITETERYTDYAHTGPGRSPAASCVAFWQPVGTSASLGPGRALPIGVMGEEFTLYRGESGKAHLVAGRCAHREHAALHRLGRGRMHPLLLSRLEIRPDGAMRRASCRIAEFREQSQDRELSGLRISRPVFAFSR